MHHRSVCSRKIVSRAARRMNSSDGEASPSPYTTLSRSVTTSLRSLGRLRGRHFEYSFSESTVSAYVDALVSGDRHLCDLVDPDRPVLTPRAFLERFASLD